jgi:putative hydrolase of the HAD superfamily
VINTLIFDFGDVFINLDKEGAMQNALNLFNLDAFEEDMIYTNIQYEIGRISTKAFINFYSNKFPNLNEQQIINAWNFIIKDFPIHRLEFIQQLKESKTYKLILLSNTNALHIDSIKETTPFLNDFKNCFDSFYLSHEIHLRKPNANIFNHVLKEHDLNAENCLFIDDTKENTDMAKSLGFNVWNINEKTEDITQIFKIKKELF